MKWAAKPVEQEEEEMMRTQWMNGEDAGRGGGGRPPAGGRVSRGKGAEGPGAAQQRQAMGFACGNPDCSPFDTLHVG